MAVPVARTSRRTLCRSCHRRVIAQRIVHPSGVVLRCPGCGDVHALHSARRFSVV